MTHSYFAADARGSLDLALGNIRPEQPPKWVRGKRKPDPSPDEIRWLCLQIQNQWDTYTRLVRAGRLSQEDADRLRSADRMRRKRSR